MVDEAWPQLGSRRWACSRGNSADDFGSPTSPKGGRPHQGTKTGLSLPSTRVDAFNIDPPTS